MRSSRSVMTRRSIRSWTSIPRWSKPSTESRRKPEGNNQGEEASVSVQQLRRLPQRRSRLTSLALVQA